MNDKEQLVKATGDFEDEKPFECFMVGDNPGSPEYKFLGYFDSIEKALALEPAKGREITDDDHVLMFIGDGERWIEVTDEMRKEKLERELAAARDQR